MRYPVWMLGRSRKELVYLVLAGMFVANALLGEILGGKLITAWGYTMSIGVIPWPVVFVTSDLVNEYFGRDGVKRLTLLTTAFNCPLAGDVRLACSGRTTTVTVPEEADPAASISGPAANFTRPFLVTTPFKKFVSPIKLATKRTDGSS